MADDKEEHLVPILGIDPGVTTFGLALLHGGELLYADAMEMPPNTSPPLAAVRYLHKLCEGPLSQWKCPDVVVETMEWRPGSAQRPSDLLGVQFVAGFLTGVLSEQGHAVRTPKPSRWKHSVPKYVQHMRLRREIEGWDRHIESIPKARREHAADAAGLAWWLYKGAEERV